MSSSNILRAVSGDTSGHYILQIVDEDTGEPYDLSPANIGAYLAVEIRYSTGPLLREIAMPNEVAGTDGLVRLDWSGSELVGALAGQYTAEVRIYTGTGGAPGAGSSRYTVWDTMRLEVRDPGDESWESV